MMRRGCAVLVCLAALFFPGLPSAGAQQEEAVIYEIVSLPEKQGNGPDDVTVVAVLDFTFAPYHWDFLASKMPQAMDGSRSNDLPLGSPPHQWLPGFPQPGKAFKSYESLELTLEKKNPDAPIIALDAADTPKWEKVKASDSDDVNYYWFPDTKIIGAVEFGDQKIHGSSSEHGTGVSSVSVGNLHGTCPECLLVFVDINDAASAEEAMEWVTAQEWIDVVSNSYGHGGTIPKIYNGRTVPNQKRASERGQTIFFSAGNGFENAFTVTNPTYMSSQKGPDWLVTVGAVTPESHRSYVGHGKPADIASLGNAYPAAYGSQTVGGTGPGFSGTSNASPTVAGMYAQALSLARRDLAGPSRAQQKGVIARGKRYSCGRARKSCELGDGKLTADELRTRLFHGAIHTDGGTSDYTGLSNVGPIGEDEFLNEGHGTYFARESSYSVYLEEIDRIVKPMRGDAKPLKRPAGEKEWMIVDSFCRQHLWGSWGGGYYRDGKSELPGPDPLWPIRTMIETACPSLSPPP